MDEALTRRPAGFWIRALALVLDLVVFALVQTALGRLSRALLGPGDDGGIPARAAVTLFTLLFTAAYTTTLHTLGGQTIGKSLLRVRVVAADGAAVTFGPALLRYFAYFVSAVPLGLGFLMAGMRRDKRALHDLIAGTRVERVGVPRAGARRPPAPSPPPPTLQDAAVPAAPDVGRGE
jgi:uncharacterized RDD family membrane protein YckC